MPRKLPSTNERKTKILEQENVCLSAHHGLKYLEYTRNIKVMVCTLSGLIINVAGTTKCLQLTVTDLEIKTQLGRYGKR